MLITWTTERLFKRRSGVNNVQMCIFRRLRIYKLAEGGGTGLNEQKKNKAFKYVMEAACVRDHIWTRNEMLTMVTPLTIREKP